MLCARQAIYKKLRIFLCGFIFYLFFLFSLESYTYINKDDNIHKSEALLIKTKIQNKEERVLMFQKQNTG